MHGGKMQLVFKEIPNNTTTINKVPQKYLCVCPYNYIGLRCEECTRGYFGQHCHPCPKHPVSNIVCGDGNICDDGVEGKGKCYCRDNSMDPNSFCEKKMSSNPQKNEDAMTFGFFLLIIVGFFVCILLYIYNKIHSLEVFPESIASIILGIVVGMFFKSHYKNTGLIKILEFEPHVFFLFLLPPIMFQAGFSMRAPTFFRNVVTINSFAIFATIIASFIFSFIFAYGASLTSHQFSYLDSLHFGAFMSAIDPVATIAIFKSLSVNDKIYMIVFGESTLNDAVAIALAQSVERINDMAATGAQMDLYYTFLFAFEKFMIYFFVSLLIGAIWSLMISFLYTKLELNTVPWIEIGFFLLTSYTPYILSESLGCSGILSILISGLFMRHYAFYSLSPFGNVTIDFLTECLGLMSENFIFAYVGISVPLMINDVSLSYVLIGIIALVVSRYLSVAIVSCCVNPFKTDKIPFSHQCVMTIGGLRGAVAFYLALNVSSEYKHLIITTTISLILFTVIGMGSATPFVIKFLNKTFPEDEIIVKQNEEEVPLNQEDKQEERNKPNKDGIPEPRHKENENQMFEGISCIEEFDKKYLQRWFRKDGWRFWAEGDEDKKEEQKIDDQKPDPEIYRRMTKNYGDLSPHRISNLVNAELQNKAVELANKNKSERNITPPTQKEIEEVAREMKNRSAGLKGDYYNNLKNTAQPEKNQRNNATAKEYLGLKPQPNNEDVEDNTQERFVKNDSGDLNNDK